MYSIKYLNDIDEDVLNEITIGNKLHVDAKVIIDDYISDKDWSIKENANMSRSVQGLNNKLAGNAIKKYWLYNIYDRDIRKAEKHNIIHIHDMDQLTAYCVGHDLKQLLHTGFCGVNGKVEATPPKHFRTALGQIVNFLYTLQGETAGAQAFSNFDTYLAPYIFFDKLDYDQVRQAMQEFIFNINVPTRVGFQTPFTNITMDWTIPSFLKTEAVVYDGEVTDYTYGDFQDQVDMLNKAFLDVMCEGDKNGRVFSFPIPTYNITKDFNWNHSNINLLLEATAKYGLPTFSNYVNSDLNPEDIRSMCCRLRIDNTKLEYRGGGQFGAAPLTGSIGVVTINLPRLAWISCINNTKLETVDEIFKRYIKEAMKIAYKSLEIKRTFVEELTATNMYPYSKFYMQDIYKRYGCYWKNHFSTIGLIGMNEATRMLLSKDLGENEAINFAEDILSFMRDVCVEFQKESGNNYNLEATPGEGSSYKLARRDVNDLPGILTSGTKENPYYTNSTHLPVGHSSNLVDILNKQDKLQCMYTGGTTLPLYFEEKIDDVSVVASLIKFICSNYKLPYFTINPTFSICASHGYIKGEKESCPVCGKRCEIFSRVVGFLRPVDNWNRGKQQEFEDRKYITSAKNIDIYKAV